jgi:hypothetical protein
MALVRRGSAKRRHDARRAWLLAHPDRYVDVPGIHDDVSEAGRQALDRLCAELLALGYFGKSAGAGNRETLRRVVSELRGEVVHGAGW